MRLFLFEVFAIPSSSMEDTLIPGDKVVVDKLFYGPQMPQTPFEIPWVNLFFYMTKESTAKIDSAWWAPRRLTGLSEIKRNDVLVFKNEPLAPGYFIKRCVALPGDELQIKNSELYINGGYATTNQLTHIKKRRRVYSRNPWTLGRLLDSLQIREHLFLGDENGRIPKIFLTKAEAIELTKQPSIDSVKVDVQVTDGNYWLYPYYRHEVWSIDNYGPLKVPFKGWVLNLNDPIAILYMRIIEKWENIRFERRDGHYYIGADKVFQYVFQNDYYFIIGDNRHNSIDSRMWGFLPEYKIVGKATHILWSNNDDGLKSNRVFKKIK